MFVALLSKKIAADTAADRIPRFASSMPQKLSVQTSHRTSSEAENRKQL